MPMFRYDSVVVGAGITGSVLAEQLASRLQQRVLLIDRRTYLGGLCSDHRDGTGSPIHTHTPHLLHTQSRRVWDYVQGFGPWRE
ncbi:MAG: NAD(P)-binding protein, partial [Pseudomonadota bacterium]